jgi:hypothetical protein
MAKNADHDQIVCICIKMILVFGQHCNIPTLIAGQDLKCLSMHNVSSTKINLLWIAYLNRKNLGVPTYTNQYPKQQSKMEFVKLLT